jgi:DNA-binding Lrp family transcriptional regulator
LASCEEDCILCIVTVVFGQGTRERYAALRAAIKEQPCVQRCRATSRRFDFMLVITAASPEAYEARTEAKLMINAAIRCCDSIVVRSSVKFTNERPVFVGAP